MGNSSSYNLHKACPEANARYERCYALFFENRLLPGPLPAIPDPNVKPAIVDTKDPTKVTTIVQGQVVPTRILYRDGVEVTDLVDIRLGREVLDASHGNYGCRDFWEDYRECVNNVMKEKQADYLKRKQAKEEATNATATKQSTPPAEKK